MQGTYRAVIHKWWKVTTASDFDVGTIIDLETNTKFGKYDFIGQKVVFDLNFNWMGDAEQAYGTPFIILMFCPFLTYKQG